MDKDKPRPLDVIAIKDLHLIELNNFAYEETTKFHRLRLKDENREFLKGIYLLGNFFSFTARAKILEELVERDHRNRFEYLFMEGEPAEKVYIIKKGEFKITKRIIKQNQAEKQ